MSLDIRDLPTGPYVLPPFDPGRGGVDFLGLRQVNLDLMAECLPGINNVTYYIRPYSVLSWIYWKFYEAMKLEGKRRPTTHDMVLFREKVESLFLWGHKLNDVTGVPGLRSNPEEFHRGKASLSFKAWRRNPENTSLQAAVQYGPSVADRGGLGFIRHVDGEFFQVTKEGMGLAEALDSALQNRRAYPMLVDFERNYASEQEASDLFKAWGVDKRALKRERETFAKCFYDEKKINHADVIGRRSATLNLILSVIRGSRRPLNEDEIRSSMAYQRLPSGKALKLDPGPSHSAKMWLLLQVRQAQRIAMESLLAWIEHRILNHHERTAAAIIQATEDNLTRSEAAVFSQRNCAAVLKAFCGKLKTMGQYIEAAIEDREVNLFWLSSELARIVREDPDSICATALKLLLLTRKFAEWFGGDAILKNEIGRGGTQRISLAYWRRVFDKNADHPIENLLSVLIENLVLAQHFAVATNRFDGGRQRLRIILEEDGLEALVEWPWQPGITRDRLATGLSLLSDSGFVSYEPDAARYAMI